MLFEGAPYRTGGESTQAQEPKVPLLPLAPASLDERPYATKEEERHGRAALGAVGSSLRWISKRYTRV